jgi:hypothetical protein
VALTWKCASRHPAEGRMLSSSVVPFLNRTVIGGLVPAAEVKPARSEKSLVGFEAGECQDCSKRTSRSPTGTIV